MPLPFHNRRQVLQTMGAVAVGATTLATTGCAQAPKPVHVETVQLPLRPKSSTPANACDCHHYIFDTRFPTAPTARIKPADAAVSDYRELQSRIGNTRNVVVQPAVYGVDNRLLLESIASFGQGNCRGIAVVDTRVTDIQLKALHNAGVRGIRFDLTTPGPTTLDMVRPLARRIAPMGWHIQVDAPAAMLLDARTIWSDLPVQVVFDQLCRLPQPGAVRHPTTSMVRDLLFQGRVFVKLSGFANGSKVGFPTYADNVQLANMYARDAPHRMLWGSGWPHPASQDQGLPDDTVLFDLLAEAVPNEATRRRILVDNPARLFHFV